MRRPLYLVLITLMAHVLSAGAGESDRPNYEEMRRYVISKLSDEQIRQMHKDSIAEFEEFKRNEKIQAEQREKSQQKIYAKCESDMAYKERHKDECKRPDFVYELPSRYSSYKQIYEEKIMGICSVARTIADARHFGCLPPN